MHLRSRLFYIVGMFMVILNSKASVKTIKRSKHLPIFVENVEMLFTIMDFEISSMNVHKQLLS